MSLENGRYEGPLYRALNPVYAREPAGRSEVTVYADVNGDRRADFEIRVAGESTLTVDDFIL